MLVAALSGVIFVVVGGLISISGELWPAFWVAIGTSMLATAVYSFFAALLTRDQLERALSGTLLEAVQSSMDAQGTALLKKLERRREVFLPDFEWDASNSPNPDYNHQLNSSISLSSTYIFQGITAKTAIARLAIVRGLSIERAVFLLADPNRPDLIVRREFSDKSFGTDSEHQSRRDGLREDILTSIVGAHILQTRIPHIDVILLSEPPVDRAEIVDDFAFLSLFSLEANGMSYPPAAAFSRSSFIYRARRGECNSFSNSPYVKRVAIPDARDIDALLSALQGCGLQLDEEGYERHKETFKGLLKKLDSRIRTAA